MGRVTASVRALGSTEARAGADANGSLARRDVVVIGASAGGVEALTTLFAGLPAELPAAVLVVLHVMSGGASVLPRILTRAGKLRVATAVDGEAVECGRAYVAPPDHHMLLVDWHIQLTGGPRENGHRPAVDPLFRSAVRAHGDRVIGVVLSGALDDGTSGLNLIASSGGLALVQEPRGALYPSMPDSALAHTPGARAVPIDELADAICAAVGTPFERDPPPVAGVKSPPVEHDGSPPVDEPDLSDVNPTLGTLTAVTCPECGGALWERDEGGVVRFKCHVGHAYSRDSLEASQGEALEGALWAALRSLQERADLYHRLARRSGRGQRLEEQARTAEQHAHVLRTFVSAFASERGAADDGSRTGA